MKKGITSFKQQRKIYEDSSRFLCIDQPNLLVLPASRFDLLLWRCIIDLGEKSQDIHENTTLSQFNKVFNNNSLFHYFAQKVDVIDVLNKKYKEAKENNQLTAEDKDMPLVLLNPDNKSKSALDIALEK